MISDQKKSTHMMVGKLLVRAYPEVLSNFDGENLYWHDGSTMAIAKNLSQSQSNTDLEAPTLFDQCSTNYPLGNQYVFGQPQPNDPGRIRNMPFFRKVYGSSQEEVERNLTEIQWMPKSRNRRIRVTRVNGVDKQLEKVSKELDQLPRALRKFCTKLGGTYNWRNIAGTDQLSPHAFGIAIDINVSTGDYWQWDLKNHGKANFVNRIPKEIVEIFERHGFIWGGKWKHYDSMHFEYRPELIMAANPNYGKIKILFISREPSAYGAERQLGYLAEGLPSDHFDPIVVHAETGEEHDTAARIKSVDSIHIHMRPWRKISNCLTRYIDAFSLLRFSQAQKIQLIHCSYQWLLPYTLFVARRMRIPVIAHIRRPNNTPGKLQSLGYHKCDAIIAISSRIRRELLAIDKLKNKVHLITDAVDFPPIKDLPDKGFRSELNIDGQVLFGLVARIYKSKRQLDFVKAAKTLLDKGYDAQFALIGRIDDEDYGRQLKSFLVSNKLTDKIHLVGHREDIQQIITSLDVLVSLAGGSVMYEAMATGRTVISAGFTKPEDSTHLIDGINGLVTESKDPNILAALMERTLTEPTLCRKLGEAAKDCSQSAFSVTTMVEATATVYNDLLDRQL
jgi:peptidoglycan LD-endopeptidase CwlK